MFTSMDCPFVASTVVLDCLVLYVQDSYTVFVTLLKTELKHNTAFGFSGVACISSGNLRFNDGSCQSLLESSLLL
jgi:hypothetical protein